MIGLDPQPTDPEHHQSTADTSSLVAAMQDLPEPATGNQKLPSLPAETILAICRQFTVEPHNPAKSFNLTPDTRDNIRALQQLSLTCRSIHAEVTPALYSCIYFTGPTLDPDLPVPNDSQHPGAESLVYFLRTMLENANLCQHVRDLACLIQLRDRCFFKENMNTLNKDYGILSAIQKCKDIRTERLVEIAGLWIDPFSAPRLGFETCFGTSSRRPIISLSHQIFSLIACLLPNLTSITLKIGSSRSHDPIYTEMYDAMAKDKTELSQVNVAKHNPLPCLAALQVQYEPEKAITEAIDRFSRLSQMMPLVRSASNLTQVRCYGPDSHWVDFPDTVTSIEFCGPITGQPVGFDYDNRMFRHLKHMVIHLDCVGKALDFNLGVFFLALDDRIPGLAHLKLLLSPGTCIKHTAGSAVFSLRNSLRLQHFCFDTRFSSDSHWDEQLWKDLTPSWWITGLLSVEILSMVDSEPRDNLDSILNWLQDVTHLVLQPENHARLRRVEYLHIPSRAEVKNNSEQWRISTLANQLRQELALRGVEFRFSLLKDGNGEVLEKLSM